MPETDANEPTRGPHEGAAFTIERKDRYWLVRDPAGTLVCLTVYKRGAQEVVRRLAG